MQGIQVQQMPVLRFKQPVMQKPVMKKPVMQKPMVQQPVMQMKMQIPQQQQQQPMMMMGQMMAPQPQPMMQIPFQHYQPIQQQLPMMVMQQVPIQQPMQHMQPMMMQMPFPQQQPMMPFHPRKPEKPKPLISLTEDYESLKSAFEKIVSKEWIDEEICEVEEEGKKEEDKECCVCLEPEKKGMLKLKCGHLIHKKCVQSWLKNIPRKGDRFLTNTSRCPVCRFFISHESDKPMNTLIGSVKTYWKRMCENITQMNESHTLKNTDSEYPSFIKNYNFYLCYDCGDLYFGGMNECVDDGEDQDSDKSKKVCEDCRIKRSKYKNYESNCSVHGKDYITHKCRFCCTMVASWFCFGTTHMCDACHRTSPRLPKPCPGPPVCAGNHVPNGTGVESEQCLGCTACRTQK